MAENAVLTVENNKLALQNKEQTRCRVTGNWILGRARLMTANDIATARHVKQEGLTAAQSQAYSFSFAFTSTLTPSVVAQLERINEQPISTVRPWSNDEGWMLTDEELVEVAAEYLQLYEHDLE